MSGQKIEVTGIKFRRLVIPEGDILIKLSGAPEDTILIPSAYLRQSQFLTIVLSSRWLKQDDDRCRLLKHPITGNDVKVHQLLLSFVEDSTTGKKKSTFFVLKDDVSSTIFTMFQPLTTHRYLSGHHHIGTRQSL